MAAKEPETRENSRVKELEPEVKKIKKENYDLKDMVDVLKVYRSKGLFKMNLVLRSTIKYFHYKILWFCSEDEQKSD